jgi:hypothetical protein
MSVREWWIMRSLRCAVAWLSPGRRLDTSPCQILLFSIVLYDRITVEPYASRYMTQSDIAECIHRAGTRAGKPLGSPATLGLVAEQVVGEDDGHHGFADRHGANSDTGVVAALGGDFDVLALGIDRGLGDGD